MRKTLTRLLAIALTLISVLTAVPFGVFADGTPPMSLEAKTASGMPGDTVKMDVVLSDNPGIASLKFKVQYDEYLTLTNVEFSDKFGAYVTTPEPYTNPQSITMISPLKDVDTDGTIATLTFVISEDAPDNYTANVNLSFNATDIYDGDYNEIPLLAISGFVKVYHGIPGDMNDDRAVDTKDAVQLFRYVAGWSVDIAVDAVDCNGDGAVNTKDAITLFRYVAEWPDIQLYRGTYTPPCEHSELQHTAAATADCVTNGNIEYWYCGNCDSYFADEIASETITKGETVIAAKGHTAVTDEAVAPTYDKEGLTEGSHCSVCKKVLVAQITIPMLQAKEHSIVYKNIKTANVPTETKYKENEGLADMPELSVAGYVFKGWYTASEGGEKIDYIPAGSTKDYILFARWDLVKYTITYVNAYEHSNPKEYTVEDSFYLNDPRFDNMIFKEWVTSGNESVTYIPQGTTGNLTIQAVWKPYRNNVQTCDNVLITSVYDKDSGCYYFLYKIGVIENVVLGQNMPTYRKISSANYTMTLSSTVSVDKSIAQEVTTTVGEALSRSSEWSDENGWVQTKSHEKYKEGSIGISGGTGQSAKFTLLGEASGTWGESDITGNEIAHTTVSTTGTSTELSHTSSIAYSEEYTVSGSVTAETSAEITGDMPNGYYTYVHAANVHVYGIVTYSPAKEEYYLETVSFLSDVNNMVMYYDNQSSMNSNACDPLEFTIPTNEIQGIAENAYFIKYDANGGIGTMASSMHKLNTTSMLSESTFIREGYVHAGWELYTENTVKIFTDKQEIIDIGSAGEEITLYSIWIPINVEVSFNENGGDALSVEKKEIEYNSKYGTLPTPTRNGYLFSGWQYNNEIISQDTIMNIAHNHTLTALWTPVQYRVIYNSNGGSGAMNASTHTYDESSNLADNQYVRSNYVFLGWSTNPSAITAQYANKASIKNLSTQDINLYAIWLKTDLNTTFRSGASTRLYKNQNTTDLINTGFDTDALKANGYTRIQIQVTFDIRRHTTIGYNRAFMSIFGSERMINYYPNKSWETITLTYSVSVDDLANTSGIVSVYWLVRKGDGVGFSPNGDDSISIGSTIYKITALK